MLPGDCIQNLGDFAECGYLHNKKTTHPFLMQIEQFSTDNLDPVEKMVTDVWGSPEHRPEFDHAFCGHLARYNYYNPELSFQIVDGEGIQGVCWACVPGETNDADAWVKSAVTGLTEEERKETYAHVDYLKSIDAAVCKMMRPGDAKISFLITRKRGYGAALMKHVMKVLSERGFENVYLWTDSSCNWQFYPKHGFELVHEERNDLYSTPEEDFRFMVFRKCLKQTMDKAVIRVIRSEEIPLLNDFLYEAIFIPEGVPAPPRSIIGNEDLQVYVRDFGKKADDRCLVAEVDGKVIGAVWTRVMDDYGHVADGIPTLAISLYKEYRHQGIGTNLLREMLLLLRRDGYPQVSLSVQKANPAFRMYQKAGFEVHKETEEEYLMVCRLKNRYD